MKAIQRRFFQASECAHFCDIMAETEMERQVMKKSFNNPDRTMSGTNARVDMVRMGERAIRRFTLQPGAHWSKEAQPTEERMEMRERVHHVGIQLSGMTRMRTDYDEEVMLRPGDVIYTPTLKELWTEGNEPSIFLSTPVFQIR
jgi:hypothetical protein